MPLIEKPTPLVTWMLPTGVYPDRAMAEKIRDLLELEGKAAKAETTVATAIVRFPGRERMTVFVVLQRRPLESSPTAPS